MSNNAFYIKTIAATSLSLFINWMKLSEIVSLYWSTLKLKIVVNSMMIIYSKNMQIGSLS